MRVFSLLLPFAAAAAASVAAPAALDDAVAAAAGAGPLVCPPGPGATCVITGVTASLPSPYTFTLANRSLVLVDVLLTGGPCQDSVCAGGKFDLVVPDGNVTLVNTTILAASINFTVGLTLAVDNASWVSADGMGPAPSLTGDDNGEGVQGTGGGHAGSGSYVYACRPDAPTSPASGQGFGFDVVGSPFEFGGASAGFGTRGWREIARGGGRVWLQAGASILLSGSVSADGAPGGHVECPGRVDCGPGGGAGGSLFLSAYNVTIVPNQGFLCAIGGDSADSGGGGGGMVAVVARGSVVGFSPATSANVTGGITLSPSGATCPVGGTGMLYLAQLEQQLQHRHPHVNEGVAAMDDARYRAVDARRLLGECVVARTRAAQRAADAWTIAHGPRTRLVGDSSELPPAEWCAAQLPHLQRLLEDGPGVAATAAAPTPPPAPRPSGVLYCSSESAVMSTTMPLIQTIVSADPTYGALVTDVVLQNCALDISQLSALSVASMSLSASVLSTSEILFNVTGGVLATDSSRIQSGTSQGVRFVPASRLRLVSAIITGGDVTITGGTGGVYIGANAFLRFSLRATITVASSLTVMNELSQVDVPASPTQLYVSAANISLTGSGRMLAGRVYLAAADALSVDGLLAVDPTSAFRNVNPCSGQPKPLVSDAPCVPGEWDDAAGFPLWASAGRLQVTKSGIVSAPALRLCSLQLTVTTGGQVSAAGLGCAGQTGYGPGQSSDQAASSGGGHGGAGGASRSLPGGKVYDNVTSPSMLGSSGGDPQLGGAGGGLIWIDASEVVMDGQIAVSGSPGSAGSDPSQGGGGGGSGGSLVLRIGSLAGSGVFDSSGGAGGAPGGGGGGGGVINVLWRGNTTSGGGPLPPPSRVPSSFVGSLVNVGGGGNTPGADGSHGHSLSAPTCLPGFGGALCLPCGQGTAKASTGNGWCEACPPGTFANGTGNIVCSPCDSLSVAPGPGNPLCTPCPLGRLPNANHTQCSLCGPGYGGPGCGACDPGSYQPSTGLQPACVPCAPGNYSDAPASTGCQPCGPGRFSGSPGADECSFCDVGTVSYPPYTECAACPGGTYATDDTCQPCAPNTFSAGSAVQCATCEAGTYSLGNVTACTACPAIPPHAAFLPNKPLPPLAAALLASAAAWMLGAGGHEGDPPAPLSGMCTYVCDDGYLHWPDCVTPLTLAFTATGGFVTLALVLVAATAAIVPVLSAPKASRRLPLPLRPDALLRAAAASTGSGGSDGYGGGAPGGATGGVDDVLLSVRAAEAAAYWDGVTVTPDPYELDTWAAAAARGREWVRASWAAAVAAGFALLATAHKAATATVTGRGSNASARSGSLDGDGTPYVSLGGGGPAGGDDDDVGALHSPKDGGSSSSSARRPRSVSVDSAGMQPQLQVGRGGQPGGGGGQSSAITGSGAASNPYGVLGGPRSDAAAGPHGTAAWPIADLQRHLHRVFFAGCNAPASPLCLPRGVPLELAAYVSEGEWGDYADEVSDLGRWAPWEASVANALRAVYLPAAVAFEATRRKAAVRRLVVHHSDFSHDFLRNTRARALGNCVRFGCSRDATLAWVDILVSDVGEDTGGVPVGQPRLPAVVPLCGDGSFAAPFRLGLEDPLAAAQLALASPFFRSIALGLNDELRRLRGPSAQPPGLVAAQPPPSPYVDDDDEDAPASCGGRLREALLAVLGLSWSTARGLHRVGSGSRLSFTEAPGGAAPSDDEAGYHNQRRRSGRSSSGSEAGVSAFLHHHNSASAAHHGGHHHGSHHGGHHHSRGNSRSNSMAEVMMSDETAAFGDLPGGSSSGELGALYGGGAAPGAAGGGGCCRGANAGPQLAAQGAALAAIQAYLADVNAELAARTAAAAAAVATLEAKRERVAARRRAPHLQLPPGVGASSGFGRPASSAAGAAATPASPGRPRFGDTSMQTSFGGGGASSIGGAGAAAFLDDGDDSLAAEEEAAAEALRQVGFGHPGYEVSLYLATVQLAAGAAGSPRRLCLLLLPRDVPPNADGTWPFYLPYGARALTFGMPAPPGGAGPQLLPVGSPVLTSPRPASVDSALKSPPAQQSGPRGILRSPTAAAAAAAAAPSARATPRRASIGGGTNGATGGGGGGSGGGRVIMFADETAAGTLAVVSSGRKKKRGQSDDGSSGGGACGWLAARLAPLGTPLAYLVAFLCPPLYNTNAPTHDVLRPTAVLALLVAADAALTILLLSSLFTLAHQYAFPVLFLPPLALLLCPVVGLVALVSGTSSSARLHASWAAFCVLPAAFAMVACSVGIFHLDPWAGLVLPAALWVVKYATLPVAASRLALLDLRSDWKRWAARCGSASTGTVLGFVKDAFVGSAATGAAAAVAAAAAGAPSAIGIGRVGNILDRTSLTEGDDSSSSPTAWVGGAVTPLPM